MTASTPEFELISLNMVGDVAVAQVTAHELRFPAQAQALSYELGLVIGQEWAAKSLIDFSRTAYIGSTGFAALVGVVKRAAELGHLVKFCGLTPDVRVGADIIGLDRIAELYEAEADALAAFAQPGGSDPTFQS